MSLKIAGRPRLPVPSSGCHARSGESQTVRSPCAIRTLLAFAAPLRAYEHVRRVVDGDPVVRLSGETVRVVGLDAPETRARCEAEQDRASSATARTRELMAGGVDYLVPRTGRTEDRYGDPNDSPTWKLCATFGDMATGPR